MKTLITATEVRAFAKTNEKRMVVEVGAIITPAAWDEARDCGISIEFNENNQSAKMETSLLEPGAVNPEFLARIVSEVVACLQQSGLKAADLVEVDPSGLKRIRSSRMVFSGAVSGTTDENVKECALFGLKEGVKFSSRVFTLTNTSFCREMTVDETLYILEGTLECTVNGKEFGGVSGDSFFLPARKLVTLSTTDRAKVFAVAAAVC